jgi:hypothetical protein
MSMTPETRGFVNRLDSALTSRPLCAEIDQQDLGGFTRRERNGALCRQADAVTSGQDDFAEHHLTLHDVQPRTASLGELVDHVLPGVEHRRVHRRGLVDAQRSSPTVR